MMGDDIIEFHPTSTTLHPHNHPHPQQQQQGQQQNRINAESDYDDDESEEDVFVGQDHNAVFRPLMYPRQRPQKMTLAARARKRHHWCYRRSIWRFLSWLLAGLACGAVVILLWYFLRTYFSLPAIKPRLQQPCSQVRVSDVWVVGFPKLTTESAFRLLDINKDGIDDVIMGFATGAEGYNVPEVVCDIYFKGIHPCQGGVQALDGRSGSLLWRHYTRHEVFAVSCSVDLDFDGIADCAVAGRMAVMETLSGADGHVLWNFTDTSDGHVMNFYTAQFTEDLDGDGVSDVINVHGGDPFAEPGSESRLSGKLYIFSGRDGKVLSWSRVPDLKESYYSPVLYTRFDGTRMVLFGTGGETHGGSLWTLSLRDLYKGNVDRARAIFTDERKGVMTPPVLVDLNGDAVDDIVFAAYSSSVLAFDGETLQLLWNFTYPSSETYATPAPGFYNEDDVPDFIVTWQYGPGFPVYYHSIVTIIDGKTGLPLLEPFVKSTVGAQTSPLTVSMEGYGGDLFLYWSADCTGHEAEGGDFAFVKGTNVHEKSRSDMCRLRFKTSGFSRMYGISRRIRSPGAVIYDSTTRDEVERSAWVNTTKEVQEFLRRHPEHLDAFRAWKHFIADNAHEREPAHQEESAHGRDREHVYRHSRPRTSPNGKSYYYNNNNDDVAGGQWQRIRNPPSQDKWSELDAGRSKHHHHMRKRHVGPHDQGGLQRLISTGTLAPPLGNKMDAGYNSSVDVIFATYWFYPARTEVLLPNDQECVRRKLQQAKANILDPTSRYYGFDDESYEHAVTHECLAESGHQLPENGTYQTQHEFNPYDIHMGQMTVYRVRIQCTCRAESRQARDSSYERCGRVLPFSEQQWAAYMGTKGDSHWPTQRRDIYKRRS